MPSSFASSFSPIVEALIAARPRNVVDIGPGWGKYGLAAREYLPGLARLVAVEVPEGRLPTQDGIYDEVIEADARTLPAVTWAGFDLVLLVDVIEHMTIAEGQRLVAGAITEGCRALVSTPRLWMDQHDDRNPYEAHLSLWRRQDFEPFGIVGDHSTPDSIILTLGPP